MKNVYYTLTMVCLLLVFDCKKDKDDPKAQIVGKWKIEKISIQSYQNGKLILDDTKTNYSQDDYWDFKADGTIDLSIEGKTSTTQYTVDEKNRKVNIDLDINDDQDIAFDIAQLDKSKFYLNYDETRTENGNTARAVVQLNFTK